MLSNQQSSGHGVLLQNQINEKGQQNDQQLLSEEEQEVLIKELKASICHSHKQMHKLISNEEKFLNTITHLNNKAQQKITQKTQFEISEALVYLAEAEKILEYAAACGKNINRQLILCVLHNQACVYQILWELEQCSNYLQALILNCQSVVVMGKDGSGGCNDTTSLLPSMINLKGEGGSTINYGQSAENSRICQEKKFGFAGAEEISSYISRLKDPESQLKAQLRLANYYFEYCAVSSQLQFNKRAEETAKKAIRLMKQSILSDKVAIFQDFDKYLVFKGIQNGGQSFDERYALLSNITDLFERSQNLYRDHFKQLLKGAHFSLQIWNENCFKQKQTVSSMPQRKQNDAQDGGNKQVLGHLPLTEKTEAIQSLSKPQSGEGKHKFTVEQNLRQFQKMKNLAIGTIMEIQPKSYNKLSNESIEAGFNEQQQPEGGSLAELDNYLLRIFLLSVGYFSVATELRLIANSVYSIKNSVSSLAGKNKDKQHLQQLQQLKKSSPQYLESMAYHLVAIIIAGVFIPCECQYMLDILSSYTKHYGVSLSEYRPIEKESVGAINKLFGFKVFVESENGNGFRAENIIEGESQCNKIETRTAEEEEQNQKEQMKRDEQKNSNEYRMQCKNSNLKSPKAFKKKKQNQSDQHFRENIYTGKKIASKGNKEEGFFSEIVDHNYKQYSSTPNKKTDKSRKSSRKTERLSSSKSIATLKKRSVSKLTTDMQDKFESKYKQLQKIIASSSENLTTTATVTVNSRQNLQSQQNQGFDGGKGTKTPNSRVKLQAKGSRVAEIKSGNNKKGTSSSKCFRKSEKNEDVKNEYKESTKRVLKDQKKVSRKNPIHPSAKVEQVGSSQKHQMGEQHPHQNVGNIITEDEEIFFFVTKKTTKTNNNGNKKAPSSSENRGGIMIMETPRKGQSGKSTSLHSSRSKKSPVPQMTPNPHTYQSPFASNKGIKIKKIASERATVDGRKMNQRGGVATNRKNIY